VLERGGVDHQIRVLAVWHGSEGRGNRVRANWATRFPDRLVWRAAWREQLIATFPDGAKSSSKIELGSGGRQDMHVRRLWRPCSASRQFELGEHRAHGFGRTIHARVDQANSGPFRRGPYNDAGRGGTRQRRRSGHRAST